jgi:hypothetical protein
MSMPQGSVAQDGHDKRVTPDVSAPPRSWSLAFLGSKLIKVFVHCVIASEAKQSRRRHGAGLRRRFAPRNDEMVDKTTRL